MCSIVSMQQCILYEIACLHAYSTPEWVLRLYVHEALYTAWIAMHVRNFHVCELQGSMHVAVQFADALVGLPTSCCNLLVRLQYHSLNACSSIFISSTAPLSTTRCHPVNCPAGNALKRSRNLYVGFALVGAAFAFLTVGIVVSFMMGTDHTTGVFCGIPSDAKDLGVHYGYSIDGMSLDTHSYHPFLTLRHTHLFLTQCC